MERFRPRAARNQDVINAQITTAIAGILTPTVDTEAYLAVTVQNIADKKVSSYTEPTPTSNMPKRINSGVQIGLPAAASMAAKIGLVAGLGVGTVVASPLIAGTVNIGKEVVDARRGSNAYRKLTLFDAPQPTAGRIRKSFDFIFKAAERVITHNQIGTKGLFTGIDSRLVTILNDVPTNPNGTSAVTITDLQDQLRADPAKLQENLNQTFRLLINERSIRRLGGITNNSGLTDTQHVDLDTTAQQRLNITIAKILTVANDDDARKQMITCAIADLEKREKSQFKKDIIATTVGAAARSLAFLGIFSTSKVLADTSGMWFRHHFNPFGMFGSDKVKAHVPQSSTSTGVTTLPTEPKATPTTGHMVNTPAYQTGEITQPMTTPSVEDAKVTKAFKLPADYLHGHASSMTGAARGITYQHDIQQDLRFHATHDADHGVGYLKGLTQYKVVNGHKIAYMTGSEANKYLIHINGAKGSYDTIDWQKYTFHAHNGDDLFYGKALVNNDNVSTIINGHSVKDTFTGNGAFNHTAFDNTTKAIVDSAHILPDNTDYGDWVKHPISVTISNSSKPIGMHYISPWNSNGDYLKVVTNGSYFKDVSKYINSVIKQLLGSRVDYHKVADILTKAGYWTNKENAIDWSKLSDKEIKTLLNQFPGLKNLFDQFSNSKAA